MKINFKVRLEDAGKYTCHTNNSAGEESVRVTLEVTASLTAHIQPQVQTVDVGKEASFQCIVGGHPVAQITWLHDGKPVVKDGRVELFSDPHRLQVSHLNKVSLWKWYHKINLNEYANEQLFVLNAATVLINI